MVYEVPPSKGAARDGKFEFKAAGAKHSAPKMRYLPPEALQAIGSIFDRVNAEDKDTEAALAALTEIPDLFGAGTKAADAVRTLDGSQRLNLLTAWAEDSGMTSGESSASTDS